MLYPLQIEMAGTKLLDYGVLGLVLFGVVYFALHLFKQQQKYTEEWRSEAKENSKAVIDLSSRQVTIQEKQAEIQEKQMAQTKEFYDSMSKTQNELPQRVIKELKYNQLQEQQAHPNVTPAP